MIDRLKDSISMHMERITEAIDIIKRNPKDASLRIEQLQILESASYSINKILKQENELESIIHPATKHL